MWYEILTVSKPATPIAMLAQPLLRFYQRQFVKQSQAAMQQQVITVTPSKVKPNR